MTLNFSSRRLSLSEHRTIALFGNPEMHLQRQMEQKNSGQENQKQTVERHEKLTESRLGERMASTLKRFENGTKARQDRLTQGQNRLNQTRNIAATQHPSIGVAPMQMQKVHYETKEHFKSRETASAIADTLTGGSLLSSTSTEVRPHGPEIKTVNTPGTVNMGTERRVKAAPSAAAQPSAKLAEDSGQKKVAQEKTVAQTGVPEAQPRHSA